MQSCGAVDSGECWGYHTSSWDNVIKTLGAPQRVDCGETTNLKTAERTEKCSETVKISETFEQRKHFEFCSGSVV